MAGYIYAFPTFPRKHIRDAPRLDGNTSPFFQKLVIENFKGNTKKNTFIPSSKHMRVSNLDIVIGENTYVFPYALVLGV